MNQSLIVIDAQQELIEGTNQESGVFDKTRLLSNINAVIDKSRNAGIPIIFIRDLSVSGGEGDGFQVHKEIHIPDDAVFFNKKGTSSFYETPLLNHLREQSVEHLVVMGCQTDYCVDTAVRAATAYDFDVTLVGDAHSTTDNKALKAEQIIAHHNCTLHGFDHGIHFSMVRNSKEDLFQPLHDNYR